MKITLLGSGNVAYFFAFKLLEHNHTINQIYNPSSGHGIILAKRANTEIVHNLKLISKDSDAYILVVKDDAIEKIVSEIDIDNQLLVHCAGSASLNLLKPAAKNRAVIWPVYSINKNNISQKDDIPILLEANNDYSLKVAKEIASALSSKVRIVAFEQRKKLHLAAVMSNNFINHLLSLSKLILSEQNLSFDLLYPIIEQTIQNAIRFSPEKSQTGPAIRHDVHTIQNHLQLLDTQPEIKEIYKIMTLAIQNFYNKNHSLNQ